MADSGKAEKQQALFLCLLAGTLDAYTYLCRGKMFCNAQTGNIVRMFMALSEQNYMQIFSCVLSLAVFSAGLYCAKYFLKFDRAWVLLFEGSILLFSALLPNLPFLDFACCMAIAFCCAVQMVIFGNAENMIYTSTVCTGNLRKAVVCWQKNQKQQSIFYVGTIVSFGTGVFLEALIRKSLGRYSILIGLLWILGALYCCLHQSGKRFFQPVFPTIPICFQKSTSRSHDPV